MKQYPFAILVACVSLIIGLILQLTLGSISKSWFSFPYNVIEGFAFVVITTAVYFIFRKTNFIVRFSSAPFAIVTVATLGILTIGLGSINVNPQEVANSFLGKLGFRRPYQNLVLWYRFRISTDEPLVFYPQTLNGLSTQKHSFPPQSLWLMAYNVCWGIRARRHHSLENEPL